MTNKTLHKYFLVTRYRERALLFALEDLRCTGPVSEIAQKFYFSKDFLGLYRHENAVVPVIRPRFAKELIGVHQDKSNVIVTKKGIGFVVDEMRNIQKLEVDIPPTYRSTMFIDGHAPMTNEKQIHYYNADFFAQQPILESVEFVETNVLIHTEVFSFALKQSHFHHLYRTTENALTQKDPGTQIWALPENPEIPIFDPFLVKATEGAREVEILFMTLSDQSNVGILINPCENEPASPEMVALETRSSPFSSLFFNGLVGGYPLLNPDLLYNRYRAKGLAAAA